MPPRHNGTITLLGLLTALTPLSVDMYLPALPSLVQEFSAKEGHVQLSLASFFLGLAIGQAFYGPMSDRFGRKLPLYAGLVLFVLAGWPQASCVSLKRFALKRHAGSLYGMS